MNVCGVSHLPAHIHLSVAKCAEMASPKNFSMGIRWAFVRILCTAHIDTHTGIHTRTHALIQRACVWVLVCSGLGPGPGLAWVSFPLCLPSLALRLLCQSWSFCFMTSSGEMCLQLLLLPASSTSLPLTWIWISRNLTSQLGWHRICVRVYVCVSSDFVFFFLCNVRNFLLFIVRLGPLCAARII